jgi:hypothetical protein
MHWMKEAEAKNKWCPMTHTRVTVLLDPNGKSADQQMKHGDDLQRQAHCIGESCACWQPQYADKREFGRCGLTTHAL